MIKQTNYNPLYFLAALGNGGLSVAFFMYLLFMIEHPGVPVVTYNHIYPILTGGNPVISFLIVLALFGMLYFGISYFRLLTWNIVKYFEFRNTETFDNLKKSNDEVSLMAIPLTLAMGVNVLFVISVVFIPGLWSYVETIFPLSIIVFLAIGIYALKIFIDYLTRIIINGDFDFINNNNLSQMLAVFAFAMISTGLAGPAAMSRNVTVSALALFLAVAFTVFTIVLATIKIVLGFKSILKQGISLEGTPSLWIVIPIVTLIGITLLRLTMGVFHNLINQTPSPAGMFVLLGGLLSIQFLFGIIGYSVLKKKGYFEEYITGDRESPSSYSLICPGVAFFVLGMFFLYWGLVETNIVNRFSFIYFLILAPFVYVHIKTIQILFKLNQKLLPIYSFNTRLFPAARKHRPKK